MLTVDCGKRISMEGIVHHRWMTSNVTGGDPEFQTLIEEYSTKASDCDPDTDNLNETILTQMETVHRLDREKTVEVR